MSVSLKGFNTQIASFESDSAVTAGMAVGITANNKVAKATAASGVAGVCVNVREGIAAIQLAGYVRVKYSGDTAPTGEHEPAFPDSARAGDGLGVHHGTRRHAAAAAADSGL